MKKSKISLQTFNKAIDMYINNHPMKQICKKYPMAQSTFYIQIKRRNINKRIKITPQQSLISAVNLYNSGMNIGQVVKLSGVCKDSLDKYMKKHNIQKRKIKKDIDKDFFQKIDTQEKAYWLGFITADGNVYKKNLKIKLSSIDRSHLQKFLFSIKSKHIITDEEQTNLYKNQYKTYFTSTITINNKKILSDLLNLGITPNKSFTVKPCQKIPQELIHHYIRGIFDGDGCLSVLAKKKNAWSIQIIGSFWIVQYFNNIVNKLLSKQIRLYKSRNIYATKITSLKNVKKVIQYLYNDATIYLDRKYEKAKDCLKCEYINKGCQNK